MWLRVSLDNFRSFEHVRIELSPFTILVGRNATGKSNFVEAIVLARDVGTDAASAIDRLGGIVGVRRWSPSKPYDVTVEVRTASTKGDLDETFVRHRFTIKSGKSNTWAFSGEEIEVRKQGDPVFVLTRDRGKVEISKAGKAMASLLKGGPALAGTASAMVLARQIFGPSVHRGLGGVRRIRLNPEAMRKPQLATDSARLESDGANVATAIRRMKDGERASVVETLRKIIPGLEDLDPETAGRYLTLSFSQRQSPARVAGFAATEMSEGSLRALGIIVAAAQMRPNELLVIEEPEVNVHPGAAGVLFQILKEAAQRGSVLLTTHSPELLDAAKDEDILVCDYRDGVTRIGQLAIGQRNAVRDGLFSVSELMRSEPLRIEGDEPQVLTPTQS